MAIPLTNAFGSSTVVITVSDGQQFSTAAFVVRVTPVNDPPTLPLIPDQATDEDVPLRLGLTIEDVDKDSAQWVFTGVSSKPALVPDGNITTSGTGNTRSVLITPAPEQSGTTTITLTLSDGSAATNRSFNLTIRPVNDPPTLTPPLDLTIDEDSGARLVNLSGIGSGASNETQSLTVTTRSSRPEIVPAPRVTYNSPSTTGTLTLTPATNAFGAAVITVSVKDDGTVNNTTERSFTVTVRPVDDPPTISNIPDQQTREDTPLTVPFVVNDPDIDPFSLLLTVTSSNTNLVANTNIWLEGSGTNRTLTLVPSPDLFGTTTVSVAVSDGVRSANDTFVLTVAAVNDPPTLNPIPDQLTVVGGPDVTVNLSGISRGPSNELTGSLVLTATSSNIAVIAIGARSYASPNPTGSQRISGKLMGVTTVAITVDDSQATNRFFSQSFLAYATPSNNVLPTLTGVTDRVIDEDGSTGPIPFTVADAETPPENLTLRAWPTNPELFPEANIVMGGTGTGRTVDRVSPTLNRTGTARIYLEVVDRSFGMTNTSFSVTVNPLNDLPLISEITDQTLEPNTATGVIPFTIFDTETPATLLGVTAASSNPTLVPSSGIVLGGSGTTRAVRVTPAASQTGTATVTLTVTDAGGGTATESFFMIVAWPIPPELRWQQAGPGTLRLLWPDTAVGYRLQERTGLNPNQAWSDVTTPPVLIGSEYAVDVSTVTPTGSTG